ncbi:polysaccharide deacetylase family protein [Pseudarthrobacter sp. P1]|uniref:polysaccharide deacetylase family protein n=1 Tax=Pseudarthrobacter sp. P1 TaxID=3418418 RepID=UPI003CF22AA2
MRSPTLMPWTKAVRPAARFGDTLGAARRWLRWTALAAVAAMVGVALLGVSVPTRATAAAKTIVSLTFDDGNDNQMAAEQVLKAHGLVGTFFITTSWIGQPGWLTRAQLQTIAADGNEIGGHTVTHPMLTTETAAAAKAEVCDGRTTLASWGFNAVNFAYPFADENAAVEKIVKDCGFASARSLGDIRSPASCPACPFASPLPPANPYATEAPDEVDSTWTMQNLQSLVTNAETTGGWLQLTFHHIAVGTDPTLTISPTLFEQFIVWLAARTANGTTSVQTVAQALGQKSTPAPPQPPAQPAPPTQPAQPPAAATSAIAASVAANPGLGASSGPIAYPLTGGGASQTFANGAVYWSAATGAHTAVNGIRQLWSRYAYQAGRLGYPSTDEIGGLRNGGVYQMFQGGAIIWSPASGAHISVGGIRQTWSQVGFENGQLGYPTTDEIGGLRNGGIYQMYQGGAIIWSPATGSHVSMGGIRQTWASTGLENGRLGYPTSNEYAIAGGGVAQDYQGGRILWTPALGSRITYN